MASSSRKQIDHDLADVQKRLARANAHGDLEQIAYLLAEYDRLLDQILELRKVDHHG